LIFWENAKMQKPLLFLNFHLQSLIFHPIIQAFQISNLSTYICSFHHHSFSFNTLHNTYKSLQESHSRFHHPTLFQSIMICLLLSTHSQTNFFLFSILLNSSLSLSPATTTTTYLKYVPSLSLSSPLFSFN
jgi:hypothetical protein